MIYAYVYIYTYIYGFHRRDLTLRAPGRGLDSRSPAAVRAFSSKNSMKKSALYLLYTEHLVVSRLCRTSTCGE